MIALDEVDDSARFAPQSQGRHYAGEAAARTQIDPATSVRRDVGHLKRVLDVPDPNRFQRRRRDQIHLGLPFQQDLFEDP